MQTVEIQKGVKVGFEELLSGAAQLGTADLEKFTDRLSHLLARRKTPRPTEREVELLKQIYEPLKRATQRRYDFLHVKLVEETISDLEHQELISLVETVENQNVEWLKAIVELARLRAVPVEDLMKQLGIKQQG
jgi:hypothetical protein